jgi:hypothetical protein
MLRLLCAGVLLLFVGCASTTSRYPRELWHRHEIFYFEDAEQKYMKVADILTISRRDEAGLVFKLEITANNFHTCWMEGTAVRSGEAYEYRVPLELSEEPADCILRITPDGRGYIVEDVGNLCHHEWCGVRGVIGRIAFKP